MADEEKQQDNQQEKQQDNQQEKQQDNQQDKGPFKREQFLKQIKAEFDKNKRGALKNKVQELLKKRGEAERALAVIDKEIDEEITKYEKGLY